jgi:hypothetical protein
VCILIAAVKLARHTPRFNVKGDNGLGSGLHLALLLLLVLLDTGSLELLVLLIILVVGAEEVNLIVILLLLLGLLLGSLGGVDGKLLRARAVGGEVLGGVSRELGELRLVGGNVLVPAVGEGVLLNRRSLLDLLEDLHIGLGRVVTGVAVSCCLSSKCSVYSEESMHGLKDQRCAERVWFCLHSAGS